MGSGKSTVGREVAKELGTYFIDTDDLIEHFENRAISDIFEKEGEEAFRQKERYCFEWIKKSVKNTVISVGGGFPVFVPEIKKAGKVIYLKVGFDEIVKRLDQNEIKKRPLFADTDKAKELFEKRSNIYEKLADYIIENRDLKTTTEKIKRIINGCK